MRSCFLVMGLAPLLGVIEMKTAMAHFGSWINLFLLGAFVLGRNLDRTQAARRLALWVCSLNIMKHRPWTFFTIFTLVTCVSPVLLCSSIVATVVFTTIGISFFEAIGVKKGDKFGSMFVLAVTWAATAGSMIFAWGTVINLFAMGVIAKQTGYQLGMLEWTYYGVIAAGVSYLMFWLVCRFVARIDVTQMKEVLEPVYILEERKKLGPMNSGEKASIIVMCVAIFLWFLPEIFSIASPGPTAKWLKTHLTWPTTALVLAAACTLIPVKIGGEKRMLLNWPEWTKSVEWGVLAIIAAGLILGDVLSDNTTGIPQFFMDNLGALVKGGGGEYILLFLVVGLGCLMTECMSNFGPHCHFHSPGHVHFDGHGRGQSRCHRHLCDGCVQSEFCLALVSGYGHCLRIGMGQPQGRHQVRLPAGCPRWTRIGLHCLSAPQDDYPYVATGMTTLLKGV